MAPLLHFHKGFGEIYNTQWKILNDLLILTFCLAKPVIE